ncbi:DEAD/DEAH box helicase family protein [Tritrichomonas foetus]|uniref:DEAD/DEAH box helicase family protein n=1 Tax=Tritrichomonas foetus TaxID=1144522 RepID=A0A1J4JWS1_9EUKA|nr:DEAD/DEAH box helicase family protein [Tritrichomonas foetus]|eukprot:OHT01982.1 DEAD/DEAH box helicase family protein [Tritrichomonas foetus]
MMESIYDFQLYQELMFEPKKRKILHEKNYHSQNHKQIIDYDTTDEMGNLFIPAFLQHQYINGSEPITRLRSWQKELLSTHYWEDKRNCVAVAPTSGGKTLIAEVAIAQLLEEEPHSKALYTLPFVALAAEKTIEFETKFQGFSVKPFFQNVGSGDFFRGQIGICTYEKAHSLINSAIIGKYDNKIKLVVIDEVHLISDETRGVTLESLIMKLMSMRCPPRILALTATLNEEDAKKLSLKMNGYAYFSSKRNTELERYISSNDGFLYRLNNENERIPNNTSNTPSNNKTSKTSNNCLTDDGNRNELIELYKCNSIPIDKDNLIPIVRTNLLKSNSASVLIFVNSRNDTKKLAMFLYNHINDNIDGLKEIPIPKQSVITMRKELSHELAKSPAGIDPILSKCFMKGIGYHHAGLLLEERRIIEKGLREGSLSIIVATTTLSAGVNIRSVSRVVIYSPYRYVNGQKVILPESLFAQMAGRSGRIEKVAGDVVVIARNEQELKEISQHISKPLPSITTALSNTTYIDTYVLQALSLGLATDIYTILTFAKTSFNETNETVIKSSISRLLSLELIKTINLSNYIPTILGNAISSANLTIQDGIKLNESTKLLLNSICLIDNLHLIYLCTPSQLSSSSSSIGMKLPSFQDPIWESIFEKYSHVISLITSKNINQLRALIIKSYAGHGDTLSSSEEQIVFEKIYGACILSQIIEEVPMAKIERKYKIDRGTIQMLQSNASAFAGQATKFCESMNLHTLAVALSQFTKRLGFGVKSDLIELMMIPSMRREFARALIDYGYQTVTDVAQLTPKDLVMILPKLGEGLNETDFDEMAKKICEEARTIAEQLAILEEMEDEATWKIIQDSESDMEM